MDKIRILWVQDTPDDGEPGRQLPESLSPYFEVCFMDSEGMARPVMSLTEMKQPLAEFWRTRVSSHFPAEILAVDYDLAKRAGSGVRVGRPRTNMTLEEREAQASQGGQGSAQPAPSEPVDFDGLLLGLFYATLTYDHPAGFVPTTYQMGKMPVSVPELQELVEPFLGIDFQFIGKRRTWASIARAGVDALRKRMVSLYKAGKIDLSFHDLNSIADGPEGDQTLEVRSPHGVRQLPIRGLFFDSEADNWVVEAQAWAGKLLDWLCEGMNRQAVLSGMSFANLLFDAYVGRSRVGDRNAEEVFDERWELSRLAAKEKSGAELTSSELDRYGRLKKLFGVKNGKCGDVKEIFEIRTLVPKDSADGQVVRWTCLYVLVRLIEHLIRARSEYLNWCNRMELADRAGFVVPIITEAEWLMALFPLPGGAAIMPFHKDLGKLTSETWVTRYLEPNGIKLNHVLDGTAWDGVTSFGLSSVDRRILSRLAKDIDVDWPRAQEMVKNLWGSAKEVQG